MVGSSCIDRPVAHLSLILEVLHRLERAQLRPTVCRIVARLKLWIEPCLMGAIALSHK
jgi:hypothetical protein